MDKKDITYIVAAFCFILVIAFVIKPLATGQPVKHRSFLHNTDTSSSLYHPPCNLCNYQNASPYNPPHTSTDLERKGPDPQFCQSEYVSDL